MAYRNAAQLEWLASRDLLWHWIRVHLSETCKRAGYVISYLALVYGICRAGLFLIGLRGMLIVFCLFCLSVLAWYMLAPNFVAFVDPLIFGWVVLTQPFVDLRRAVQETGVFVRFISPRWRSRVNSVFASRYIVVLRHFSRFSEIAFEKTLAGTVNYIPRPTFLRGVRGRPLSLLGFQSDCGQLPNALSNISIPVVILLWEGYIPILPKHVTAIPADPAQWKEAIRYCIHGAAGILAFWDGALSPGLEFEFGVLNEVNPDRVLVLLDVPYNDIAGRAEKDWPGEYEFPLAEDTGRSWSSRCPGHLRSRTVPLGADVEGAVRLWLEHCAGSKPRER